MRPGRPLWVAHGSDGGLFRLAGAASRERVDWWGCFPLRALGQDSGAAITAAAAAGSGVSLVMTG